MIMVNLIPLPREINLSKGEFIMPKDAAVYSEIELELVKSAGGEDAPVRIYTDSSLGREEYRLKVNENGVEIKASEKAGAYYALQSVRMLGRFDEGKNRIPFVEISDKPAFSWRGIHLDESRHFFGVENVKSLLDDMFRLKLNVFHWHLTDDQGWRIEIKSIRFLQKSAPNEALPIKAVGDAQSVMILSTDRIITLRSRLGKSLIMLPNDA